MTSSGEFCGNCLQEAKTLLACASCLTEKYCSKSCQIKDWPSHRNRCKRAKNTSSPSATTPTTGGGNLLKAAEVTLASTPEVQVHPFREGKLLRNRPCGCFDAPMSQYHRRAKMGLCFNYIGQCDKPLEACKLVSELRFPCELPDKQATHVVRRHFCSEACEKQTDTAHALRNILDLDEYRKLVEENVRKAREASAGSAP